MKKIILGIVAVIVSSSALANISATEADRTIRYFYKNYVFGHKDLALSDSILGTPNFLKKLSAAYDYDCDAEPCYATYMLRTSAQDGPAEISGVTQVVAKSNGWYRVNYRDMGWVGITDIKLVKSNGYLKLDDYKFIKSNVK